MGIGEVENFQTLFKRLDSQTRLEFVAALYTARGWNTQLEGGSVVATQDGETRQITILQPPRFGTFALPDTDVIVVTEANDTIHTKAENAGIDYKTPSDLQRLLLYGINREAAVDIFEAHFDRPLSVINTDSGVDEKIGSLSRFVSSLDLSIRQVSLMVIVLALIAVLLSGVGLQPASEPVTVPPESNQTYTPGHVGAIGGEREYPPGLGPEGIENSGKLTVAHFQYLTNRSFAYRISATGPQHAPFLFGLTSWNATVKIENRTTYRFWRHSLAPYGFRVEQRSTINGDNVTVWEPIRNPSAYNDTEQESLTKEAYANRTVLVSRTQVRDRVEYRYISNSSGGPRTRGVADRSLSVRYYLESFLWTNKSSIRCIETTNTGSCLTYRVEATGEPMELRGDVGDYRAIAVVESTGFIRKLTVQYTIPQRDNPEKQVQVRFQLNYTSVGDETVLITPPEWLDTARNQTERTDTETPNE